MSGKFLQICLVLALLQCQQHVVASSSLRDTCNERLSMRNLTGDVIIGGLFPLNYYSTKNSQFVLNHVAITWVEAFVFAVRQINNNESVLPGIQIGYDIQNSCNEEDIAIRNILDFMLDLKYVDKQNNNTTGHHKVRNCVCVANRNRIMAVVGGASSSISTSVSNVLAVDGLAQISYSSTSVALSNKDKYPNFLRTLPSDVYQAKAIVALLKFFNWSFVNVLASDDDYGRLGFYQLERELKGQRMCLAELKIFKRTLNTERLNEIIDKLKRGLKKQANVVVLWCQINEAKTIIEETWKRGLRDITWIGCETLGNNIHLLELGEIVNGFLGLKPTLNKVPEFENHLDHLSPESGASQSPWLKSYWGPLPNCRMINSSNNNSTSLSNFTKFCAGPKSGKSLPRSKYSHVITAVYAIALALDKLTHNTTRKRHEKLSSVTSRKLNAEIKKVKFFDQQHGIKISFNKEGDPEFASYTFTNIQRSNSNGTLNFVDVGTWDGESGKILIENSKISWAGNSSSVKSKCSEPCSPGMFKIKGDVSCCWTCVTCKIESFSENGNVTACKSCPDASISNQNKTGCIKLREIHFSRENAMFHSTLLVSFLAVISVLFIIFIFLKYWNTPVVKSSNRELSLFQLTMFMASLWYPTSYLLATTRLHCTLGPIWLSFCPTMVLAIAFVKTHRLYRIFNKKTTEESKMLHNKYQSVVVILILLIELMIAVSWLSVTKLIVIKTINRSKRTFIRHCCDNSGTLLVMLQCYNLSISLACAFMAFRARKLPDAFNEARYMTFGTFIYCIAWIFSIPLYLSVGIVQKSLVICAMNTISNFAFCLCLYAHKVRIILFVPERNTRHFFTHQATIKHFVRTHTGSASMTSSWPALPYVRSSSWSTNSTANNSPQSKHLSMGSVSSLVSSNSKKLAGTCNPRTLRKFAQTPTDILHAKYGRERSQTID